MSFFRLEKTDQKRSDVRWNSVPMPYIGLTVSKLKLWTFLRNCNYVQSQINYLGNRIVKHLILLWDQRFLYFINFIVYNAEKSEMNGPSVVINLIKFTRHSTYNR